MNRIRLFTSGLFFLFSIYCLIWNPELPFNLSGSFYLIAFAYFAYFPIKDMLSFMNNTLYKGRQFAKNYQANNLIERSELLSIKKLFNKRAILAFLFWLGFLAIPGSLFLLKLIGREWIFFFFALSNFSVFFAVFGWCPFHHIMIKPECCLDCRIYNWDSFFQYSFLIFIPNVFTLILFLLGTVSLIRWEITHDIYPERFYKRSNRNLSCEKCDMEHCKRHNKEFFKTSLKESVRRELEEERKQREKIANI